MQRARLKQYQWYLLDSVQLTAIALTAVALMSAGAHVFDMSANLSLKQVDYVTLQTAHHGWALFVGAMLLSASAIGFHAYLVRGNSTSLGWSIAALVLTCLAQLMFWVVAFPIDVETGGWTALPADFESARRQWEYAFATSGSVELHRPPGTCPLDRGQPPRRQHGDPRVDRARRGRARRTRACAVHGRRRQADRAGATPAKSSGLAHTFGFHWYIHVSERVSSPRRR